MHSFSPFSFQLDDATIQVYKDGDYGAYLDLESSLAEQSEEIEGLHSKYVTIIILFIYIFIQHESLCAKRFVM